MKSTELKVTFSIENILKKDATVTSNAGTDRSILELPQWLLKNKEATATTTTFVTVSGNYIEREYCCCRGETSRDDNFEERIMSKIYCYDLYFFCLFSSTELVVKENFKKAESKQQI